jgi:hypothetical protein
MAHRVTALKLAATSGRQSIDRNRFAYNKTMFRNLTAYSSACQSTQRMGYGYRSDKCSGKYTGKCTGKCAGDVACLQGVCATSGAMATRATKTTTTKG